MRAILAIGCAALTLSACGGGAEDTQANNVDAMTVDNMMMNDGGAMTGPGGMDGNMATNEMTENMMMNDMNTNDPDTNLANGM